MPWGVMLAVMVAMSVAVAVYIAWPLLVGRPDDERADAEGEDAGVLDELLVLKDATYSAIKELEFDHAMGNLSNQDYRELASRYEDKAVALLKTIDQVSESGLADVAAAPAVDGVKLRTSLRAPDDAIERQVAALRRTRGKVGGGGRLADLEDEIERDVVRLRAGRQPSRGRNGDPAAEIEQQVAALRATRNGGTASAPASTDTPAPPAHASCPNCGAPLKSASAAFCSRCGVAVATLCPVCDAPAEAEDAFCSACGTSLTGPTAAGTGKTILGGTNA